MKIKTNYDAEQFLANLPLVSELENTKVSWALMRSEKLIKKYLKENKKNSGRHPEHEKFTDERIALCEKYAKKSEEGEVMFTKDAMGRQAYDIPDEKKDEFGEEMKKLEVKYKNLMEHMEKQKKENEEFQSAPFTGELHKFKQIELPPNLTKYQLEVLECIMEEEEDKPKSKEGEVIKLNK